MNVSKSTPPVNHDVKLDNRSAAVNFNMAPVNEDIPFIALLSIPLAPCTKPWIFSMNLVRLVAISGNPDDIPAPIPPIILPTKSPMA